MLNTNVSVVVPAYNSEKTIEKTIKGILDQSFEGVDDIIIVDDGSIDKTAEKIKSFPNVKYIFQENSGPAAARNRGIKQAKNEIVFLTDSDCVPQKDWIKISLKNFENKDIAVVAGSYGIANPKNILARCIYKEIIYRHNVLIPVYPKVFGSYNFGIRKKVFEQVGGFNEQFRKASGEDNDLSYKILKQGHKIYFEKGSLVDHHHTTRIKKYLLEQYRHGFWRVKVYFLHPNMSSGDDYTFWKDIMEIPLAYLLTLFFILFLFFSKTFGTYFLNLILFLFLLEILFSFFITKNFFEVIFFNFVMFLRVFFRAFGFSSGIIHFLLKKRDKKVK